MAGARASCSRARRVRTGCGSFRAVSVTFIDFPLRSKRALKGIARGLPSCGRTEGEPCPPGKARDYLQAAIFVSDGNSNPWVVPRIGLFVRK